MSLYRALSEDEVMKARFNLLEEGDYDAVVKVATRRTSTQGNVMADMYLSVFDNNGNAHEVRDFLVFTEKMLWKIKHFCDSSGQSEIYAAEKFEPEMASNQHVRVRIGIAKGNEIPFDKLNGKVPGSFYPDKNVVNDYIADKCDTIGKPKDEFINDAIPF